MEIERLRGVATIITFPLVDADGDTVTGATSPDSEIDSWSDGTAPNGFTDCTNEATEIGTTGQYYLSLSATEMDADYIIVQVKSGTAKTQTILIRTKQIGIIHAGLAQSATASTIVLNSGASLGDNNPIGSLVLIVAGTGAGQSPRVITGFVTATDTATISPNWTTTPDNTSVAVVVASAPAPAMVESYAADGAAPTMEQALFQILQFLTEKSISGTTMTVKKLDGSTTAMTFTLDDATTPTSVTRAS